MKCRTFRLTCLFLAVLGTWPGRAAWADLSADELVLIVNRNVPEGKQLAEFYQQARQVPEGRIIELDLPVSDQISRDQYEQSVVPPVRKFLMDAGLRDTVRCAVSFYGMPLIIEGVKLTDAQRQERTGVNREADAVAARLAPLVREAEESLKPAGYDPPPLKPSEAARLSVLLPRLSAAEAYLSREATQALSQEQRQALAGRIAELRKDFDRPFDPDGVALDRNEYEALQRRTDEEGRRLLREMLRKRAPLQDYADLLHRHQRLLSEEQSHAALDSELAMLWIDNAPASSWLANPLARSGALQEAARPLVLMVSRLDGRDPQQVRDLIATGMRVERDGLAGKIVIDSRGIAAQGADGKPDGYGVFDEQLRRLADFLKQAAVLSVVHDDRAEVIQPPGETDVAVYVGWYSLARYVASIDFADGAVGYHVASLEMRSLRDASKPGWVRGLMDDGVVATVGPVAEPYLAAFPPPQDFVPLLLTGELCLAEVYWRTVPMMSWQMSLIGDPLYRPFKAVSGLPAQKLPAPLRLKLAGD